MRFNRSADPFPRKGGNWLTTSGDGDHRIVQLIPDPLHSNSPRPPIYVYRDGEMETWNDWWQDEDGEVMSIFFRPHVFYGNTLHQSYASGISYRPIAVKDMKTSDSDVETFFIAPMQWKVAGVWDDTEFDGSDWESHAMNQDLKKIFDDWSLPRNVDRIPGKPNKWVWNESSSNRWKGILIDGLDHGIWLGDDRSVKQMLSILGNTESWPLAYDAINNQFMRS
jgi:hypothetical protein